MEIPIEDDGDDEVGAEDALQLRAGADYSPLASAPLQVTVPAKFGGGRLDVVVAQLLPEHSRSRLQTWIREERVAVDGRIQTEPRCKIHGGETITVVPGGVSSPIVFSPEPLPLSVVYEDDDIAVIDKPAGLVVHPGNGNWSGTLLNGLLHRYPASEGIPRAGIVHRLDKDTSGLMVVARTLIAQTDLVRQLQARTVKRQYLAVAIGRPLRASGTVDAPIGRHPRERTRMAIVAGGKPARTHYRVVETFSGASVVECELDTGRTHQIRVHMASLKLPLVGDSLYRGRLHYGGPPFPRQALHAQRLGLIHPTTREPMEWISPLPEDMRQLIEVLRSVV